jgi:hypothetical protein
MLFLFLNPANILYDLKNYIFAITHSIFVKVSMINQSKKSLSVKEEVCETKNS